MEAPTIYKFPKKSLKPNVPTNKAKRLWQKHRQTKGKNTALPKLKN